MTLDNHYDLLIAGGGPAGLSAAYSAAREGLRVAVFERSREIGYPIHTSGGSWIKEMRDLGIPDTFMHPIKKSRFIAPEAEAVFEYKEPVGCILDVRSLYQYLAKIAIKSGAAVFPAKSVQQILFKNKQPCGLRLKSKEDFFAPLLIDATGMAGTLAQQVGLRHKFVRYGIGAEYDLVEPEWQQDTVGLIFGSLAGKAGYGWIFPHGDERVRLGVGLIYPDTQSSIQQALETLRTRLISYKIPGCRFSSPSALEYHTGVIQQFLL